MLSSWACHFSSLIFVYAGSSNGVSLLDEIRPSKTQIQLMILKEPFFTPTTLHGTITYPSKGERKFIFPTAFGWDM